MKQLISSRLSFYFYVILCFAGSFIDLDALNFTIAPGEVREAEILNMYTTLRVIRMVHDDTHDQLLQEVDHQPDFIVDVMTVFVGVYEKIVGATVTYYLIPHLSMKQNLHDIVGRIIADGVIEIASILSRQLIYYISNQSMTLREKIWYCAWAISIIALIKVGIDQIPQFIQSDELSDFVPEHIIYNLPSPIYDLNKIRGDRSGYLRAKSDE